VTSIEGPDDVTKLPLVTEALAKHGYSDEAIQKILGWQLPPII
jgi:microsomal dipeptidase-like Zn-dependent dipeptidase